MQTCDIHEEVKLVADMQPCSIRFAIESSCSLFPNARVPTLIDVTGRQPTRSIPSMGHGNTDIFESSDSGSVVSSRQREGPPDSSARWTPGNFEGFLLNACFATELGSLCL